MSNNDPLRSENLKRVKRVGEVMMILGLWMIILSAWLLWGTPGAMIAIGIPMAAIGAFAMSAVINAEKEKALRDQIKKKMGLSNAEG